MFTSRKKRIPVNDSLKLCFYKNPIKRVESIPFLDIILYEALSWKPHILALLQKVRRNIGILFKLRSYLNINNLKNIFYSLVVSHLRYCITSWNHGNKTLVQNLENLCFKVQKQIISTTTKTVICYPLEAYISWKLLSLCSNFINNIYRKFLKTFSDRIAQFIPFLLDPKISIIYLTSPNQYHSNPLISKGQKYGMHYS